MAFFYAFQHTSCYGPEVMEHEYCAGVDEFGEFVFDYRGHWYPDPKPSRKVCYEGPAESLANRKHNFWMGLYW